LQIITASPNQAHIIAALGIITFYESYHAFNSTADITHYTAQAFDMDTIRSEIASTNQFYFIVWIDTLPIAYIKININDCPVWIQDHGNAIEIQRIYVLQHYQSQGIGASMFLHALQFAQTHNKNYIWLGVWKENQKANNFYRKMNMQCIGERSFHIGEKKYDDFIYGYKIN